MGCLIFLQHFVAFAGQDFLVPPSGTGLAFCINGFDFKLDLESAAFLFHMILRDLENHQVPASRVF